MEHRFRSITSLALCFIFVFNLLSCLATPAAAADPTGTEETAAAIAPALTAEAASAEEYFAGTLSCQTDRLTITVECSAADQIPASAQLTATAVSQEHEQYTACSQAAESHLKTQGYAGVNFQEFWQLSLLVDGEATPLPEGLSVTVSYTDYTNAIQKGSTETLHLLALSGETVQLRDYSVVTSEPSGSGMLIRSVRFTSGGDTYGLVKTARTIQTLSATAGECTVQASFDSGAGLEGASFSTRQIDPAGGDYDNYFDAAQEYLGDGAGLSAVYAVFYDLSFLLEGQQIEPAAAVELSLSFDSGILMGPSQSLRLIHFRDDGSWESVPVTIRQQTAAENQGEYLIDCLGFTLDSFSVIGIIVFDKGSVRVKNVTGSVLTGAATAKVSKSWRDENGDAESASVHANDSVTVELCKVTETDGETRYETVQSAVLNAANDWNYTFTGLDPGSSYSIRESKVTSGDADMTASYQSAIDSKLVITESWAKTDTLTDGSYYALQKNGTYCFLRRSAAINTNALRYYQLYPSSISLINSTYTESIWQAIDNGDGTWSFLNAYSVLPSLPRCYLTLVQDGDDYYWRVTKEQEEGSRITVKDGLLSATAGGVTRYLQFPASASGTESHGVESGSATKVNLYCLDQTIEYSQHTLTNTKNYTPESHEFSVNASLGKRIDYLGDGADNPDTDADSSPDKTTQDLYRLYLDYTPENDATGLDLLLVLDVSSSMRDSYITLSDGTQVRRLDGLMSALNSFIPDFLTDNPRNRMCIVLFNYYSMVLVDWSSDPDAALAALDDERIFKGSGTNYEAALMRAHEAFSELGYSTNAKAMLFFSDGEPYSYISGNDSVENGNVTVALGDGVYLHSSYGVYGKVAAGLTMVSDSSAALALEQSQYAATSFQRHNQDVTIGTIAYNTKLTDVLKQLATSEKYATRIAEGSPSELLEAMNLFTEFAPSDVSVTDELSDNVELYTSDPDFKVVMTDPEGVSTVLYENGSLTTPGRTVLDNTDPISVSGREVKLKFNASYDPEDGCTYTMSFNVRSSQTAFDRYADAGGAYPDTGSASTDYSGNTTSSAQPGLYSNGDGTRATWHFNGAENNKYYSAFLPVIQVRDGTITIRKVDSLTNEPLAGAQFALYRAADSGDSSADTVTLDGLSGSYVLAASGTTGSDGTLTLEHLRLAVFDAGYSYYLVETGAPPGHSGIPQIIPLTLYQDRVTLDGSAALTTVLETGIGVQVGNEPAITFTFTKTREDSATPLSGAEFALYRLVCTDDSHDHSAVLDPDDPGGCWVLYYQKTSGADGKLSFDLPISSTCRLVETRAPEGYVLPAGQWTITVSATGGLGITAVASASGTLPPAFYANGDGTYRVMNVTPRQIPTTGGPGPGLYRIVGITLTAAGIALGTWNAKRKKKFFEV